jgi:NAD(P)-dependent dehydrogenase (short-subunit alcohol dehydrogenase family)
VSQQGRLSGSVAIVTAAGQGLGEAISKMLAGAGASIALVDINLEEASRVCAEIEAAGGSVVVLPTDVTKSDAVNKMVDAVVQRWGTVDILVNAAGGFTKFAPITEIAEEEWDRVITLNLKSAFLCTKAVTKIMIEKRKGRIISIASGAGVGPRSHAPSYIPYGAAKAGLIGFGKLLARDLGEYGITVNTVTPGTTLTPRVRKVRDAASIEKIKLQNPMRSLVEPEDTAEAVLFLASGAARYITGVNLNVSAGNLIV